MRRLLLVCATLSLTATCYAQLNIIGSEQLHSQTQKTNLRSVEKQDVNNYFIATDSVVWEYAEHRFNALENIVGMKLYVAAGERFISYDAYAEFIYPCIDHNKKTYTIKKMPQGYYEVTRIIRFKEQLSELLDQIGFASPEVSEEDFFGDNTSRNDTQSTNNYVCIPNDSLYMGVDEVFKRWYTDYANRLHSIAKFEEEVLINNDIKKEYYKYPIYVLTNDANESFLIPTIDPRNHRRSQIEKAEYRISQQFRRKKLIKTDTIKEIVEYRGGVRDIYQFGDIESLVSISIPFYEQLCNDIKGKDVLLVFHKNGFNDAVSGKMLKSTFVSSGYYNEYIAKYEGYTRPHKRGLEKIENFSFPDLNWVKCIDIMVSDKKLYGLFEYNGQRFHLEISSQKRSRNARDFGKLNIHVGGQTDGVSNERYYMPFGYYLSDEAKIFPKQEIENFRQNILAVNERLKTEIINEGEERRIADEERKRKHEQEMRLRRARLVEKYGEAYGNMIADREVAIGMTEEMCRLSWGSPHDKYTTTTKWGVSSVWVYNYKTYLYFYNGELKQINN